MSHGIHRYPTRQHTPPAQTGGAQAPQREPLRGRSGNSVAAATTPTKSGSNAAAPGAPTKEKPNKFQTGYFAPAPPRTPRGSK